MKWLAAAFYIYATIFGTNRAHGLGTVGIAPPALPFGSLYGNAPTYGYNTTGYAYSGYGNPGAPKFVPIGGLGARFGIPIQNNSNLFRSPLRRAPPFGYPFQVPERPFLGNFSTPFYQGPPQWPSIGTDFGVYGMGGGLGGLLGALLSIAGPLLGSVLSGVGNGEQIQSTPESFAAQPGYVEQPVCHTCGLRSPPQPTMVIPRPHAIPPGTDVGTEADYVQPIPRPPPQSGPPLRSRPPPPPLSAPAPAPAPDPSLGPTPNDDRIANPEEKPLPPRPSAPGRRPPGTPPVANPRSQARQGRPPGLHLPTPDRLTPEEQIVFRPRDMRTEEVVPPVWRVFLHYFKQCRPAPNCVPADYHSYGHRDGNPNTCHASRRAIDVHAIQCGTRIYRKRDGFIPDRYGRIRDPKAREVFAKVSSCVDGLGARFRTRNGKPSMQVIWRNGRHLDHSHFSIGCPPGDPTYDPRAPTWYW